MLLLRTIRQKLTIMEQVECWICLLVTHKFTEIVRRQTWMPKQEMSLPDARMALNVDTLMSKMK